MFVGKIIDFFELGRGVVHKQLSYFFELGREVVDRYLESFSRTLERLLTGKLGFSSMAERLMTGKPVSF
jgi:hypothetical protein